MLTLTERCARYSSHSYEQESDLRPQIERRILLRRSRQGQSKRSVGWQLALYELHESPVILQTSNRRLQERRGDTKISTRKRTFVFGLRMSPDSSTRTPDQATLASISPAPRDRSVSREVRTIGVGTTVAPNSGSVCSAHILRRTFKVAAQCLEWKM